MNIQSIHNHAVTAGRGVSVASLDRYFEPLGALYFDSALEMSQQLSCYQTAILYVLYFRFFQSLVNMVTNIISSVSIGFDI